MIPISNHYCELSLQTVFYYELNHLNGIIGFIIGVYKTSGALLSNFYGNGVDFGVKIGLTYVKP
jgi:hypothetical protein